MSEKKLKEIPKSLTKEQAIEECREMWTWIAEETLRLKRCVSKLEYFRRNYIKDYTCLDDNKCVCNECFCCHYLYLKENKSDSFHCSECPIIWGSTGHSYCCLESSPYIGWIRATEINDYESAAKYAFKIASLPERK